MKPTQLELDVINYSVEHNLDHIPSALIQASYLQSLLTLLHPNPPCGHLRVSGYPYGAQAWHVLLKNGRVDPILRPPVVHWSSKTFEHILGYALGLSTLNNVWLHCTEDSLNCSDFWASLKTWKCFRHRDLIVTMSCDNPSSEVLDKITKYTNCAIVKPSELKVLPFNDGIVLIDIHDTLGNKLKQFEALKFSSMQEFHNVCAEYLD